MNDNKKIEYVHIESSKKETTCAVCLRVIRKNSPAKTLVVDDVLRATTLYCPTGVKHIYDENKISVVTGEPYKSFMEREYTNLDYENLLQNINKHSLMQSND